MDHRLFEGWLLEDKALNREERSALQDHLHNCPDCTALAEVNLVLRKVRPSEPAAGFMDRFQVRFKVERRRRRIRQVVGIGFLGLGALALLLWAAFPLLLAAGASPSGVLSEWMLSLSRLFMNLRAAGQALKVIWNVVPGFIPGYVWTLIICALGGFGLLWVASLKKLARKPQGV